LLLVHTTDRSRTLGGGAVRRYQAIVPTLHYPPAHFLPTSEWPDQFFLIAFPSPATFFPVAAGILNEFSAFPTKIHCIFLIQRTFYFKTYGLETVLDQCGHLFFAMLTPPSCCKL
jgi:hypothetical protein